MKPLKFSTYILLALILFSCNTDQLSQLEEAEINEADEVTIKFAMGLMNLETGISRPLVSEDSIQRVLDMRVYVFASKTGDTDDSFYYYCPTLKGETVPFIPILNFIDKGNNDWTSDKFEEGIHKFSPKLPSGYYYRFLAIGFDENSYDKTDHSDISWTPLINMESLASGNVDGVTTWSTALVNFNAFEDGEKGYVSEIFSGCCEEGTSAPAQIFVPSVGNKSFNIPIMLTRAVAGVLLYVKNIPTHVVSDYTWANSQGYRIATQKQAAPLNKIAVVSIGHNVSLDPVNHEITSINDRKIALKEIAWIELKTTTSGDGIYSEEYSEEVGNYYIKKGDNVSYTFPATGNFVCPTRLYDHNNVSDEEKDKSDDDSDKSELTFANMGNMAEPGSLNLGNIDISLALSKYLKHHSGVADCNLPSSLYLVFYTKDISFNTYYPIKVKAIKNVRTFGDYDDTEEHDGYNVYGLHYNLLANHIYSIGRFATNGVKEPLDLKDAINAPDVKIWVMGSYQADVDISM